MFYKQPVKKVGGRFIRGGVKHRFQPKLAVCDQIVVTEQIPLESVHSVCGEGYPSIHAAFKPYAEELFFHTSRYYVYTERFLRELVHCKHFSMAGYSASRMSSAQRRVMRGLLSQSPEPEIGQAIIQIIQLVLRGEEHVPADLDLCHPALVRPSQSIGCHSQGLGSGLALCNTPVEPFLNFARRFHLRVDVDGATVVLSVAHLQRILSSSDFKIRSIFEEILRHLISNGYRVADRQYSPQRKHCWD